MIRPLLAAATFSFIAVPALAQMTQATCTQSLGFVSQSLQLEGPEELTVQDGRCIALAAAGNSGEQMLGALSDPTLELRYQRTQDE